MRVIHLVARCNNINAETLVKFFDSKTGNKVCEIRVEDLTQIWLDMTVDSFTIYPHNYMHISVR